MTPEQINYTATIEASFGLYTKYLSDLDRLGLVKSYDRFKLTLLIANIEAINFYIKGVNENDENFCEESQAKIYMRNINKILNTNIWLEL